MNSEQSTNKLLVVTPWSGRPEREHWLELCKESVKASGFPHLIVRCGIDWETRMFDLRNEAPYIAWVDDDDLVYPGALSRCLDALESNPSIGLAYTDEVYIDEAGVPTGSNKGPKSLMDLTTHPRAVHHLAVTRQYSVDDVPLRVFNRIGQPCPLDWLIRVRAGAQHGMIYVGGTQGYGWRIHKNQMSKSPRYHGVFADHLNKLCPAIRSWIEPTAQSLTYL